MVAVMFAMIYFFLNIILFFSVVFLNFFYLKNKILLIGLVFCCAIYKWKLTKIISV